MIPALLILAVILSQAAHAQEVDSVQVTPIQRGAGQAQSQQHAASDAQALQLDARDRATAQMWHLSDDEMLRAKLLMLGPRGSLSVPNISPVEVLGIHARNDAERSKYAEIFARAMYEDTQRVLAFQLAYDVESRKLIAGQPMISFKGLPKVNATEGAADMMGVPRSQLVGHGQAPTEQEQK